MTTMLLITIASLSLLGLLLAVILYFVSRKFAVEEDPRIDSVEEVLPKANCGGCGYAGCRAFAEACVENIDKIETMFCPVGGNEVMKSVASCLGVKASEKALEVAVIRCYGSFDNRERTNYYNGYASCAVMSSLYAGDTGCIYGCLGQGDCVAVCKFDAIVMDTRTGLPEVDDEKCTACGACVKACPKGVIELRNKGVKNRRIFVSCINKEKGGVARKACVAACIGCGKCSKVCAFDAITISDSLAYIDYNKCKMCRKCVVECPTHAIWELNFPIRVPNKKESEVVEQNSIS